MTHSRVGLKQKLTNPLGLGCGALICFDAFILTQSSQPDTQISLLCFTLLICILYALMQARHLAPTMPMQPIQDTIDHVHHMIQQLLHSYVEQHHMEYQLQRAQDSLERFHHEQEELIRATQSEVQAHYHEILAYAHYLEQRITHRKSDPSLRDDYDDVCEQAFNLQLIVQAMGILPNHATLPALASISLTDRMASLMLDLAPSLDRRAMKLTSAEWDDTIQVTSSSEWLTHLLWMVLLGCIRFAENESTLTLRCQKDGMQAKLEVTVSTLSPGALSENERYAYLEKRMKAGEYAAHMFASTLDAHANIRLAKLIASRLMAQVQVIPINDHSCAVTLLLPLSPSPSFR